MSRHHGAVSSFGACGLSCGLRGSLWTLHLCRSVFTSFTGATLGRSGGLDLTPQGRAPCQKRQASLGALTNARCQPPLAAGATQERTLAAVGCTPWFGWGCPPPPDARAHCMLPDVRSTTPQSAPAPIYWITSSARNRSVGGNVIPSACAVLRLRTSSNFLGRSTGKSAGLAPCRILSTKTAERWYRSMGDAP
jgi:hypothetical protein